MRVASIRQARAKGEYIAHTNSNETAARMRVRVLIVWALVCKCAAMTCPAEGNYWQSGTLTYSQAVTKGTTVCATYCPGKTQVTIDAALNSAEIDLSSEPTPQCVVANGNFLNLLRSSSYRLHLSNHGDCYFQLSGFRQAPLYGGVEADLICLGSGDDKNIYGRGGDDVIHYGFTEKCSASITEVRLASVRAVYE